MNRIAQEVHDLWVKAIWIFWDSALYGKYLKVYKKMHKLERIKHPVVFVEGCAGGIDIHVLPTCQKLWDEGIQTFYSCQGGPSTVRLSDGRIYSKRAYVTVLVEDAERVCKILKDRHPKIDRPNPKGPYKDRIAVRFDPSEEAL